MNDIKPKEEPTNGEFTYPAAAMSEIRILRGERDAYKQRLDAALEYSAHLESELKNASEAAKIALKNIAHFL